MKMIVDPDRIEELGRQLKNFSLDIEGTYRYVHDMVTRLVDAVDAKYHESYVRANTRALREALGTLRGNTETASRNLQDLSRYALESAQEYRARDSQLARLIAQSSIKFGLNFDMQKALSGIYRITGVSTSIGSKLAVGNLNIKLGTGRVPALLAGGSIPVLTTGAAATNMQEVGNKQQDALAKLDEIIRLEQKIVWGLLSPGSHNAEMLSKTLSEKNSVIETLLSYEEDEQLRKLLIKVKKGELGAWEEYKLRKLEKRVIQSGYISEEDKKLIEKLSIELLMSRNLGKQIIYEDLDELRCRYPIKGAGTTREDIDKLKEEGKGLAGIITTSIQNRIYSNKYSNRPDANTGVPLSVLIASYGVEGDTNIIMVQACLSVLGFPIGDSGPNKNGVDGDWGARSKAAVRAYQQMKGLEATGKESSDLAKSLLDSVKNGETIDTILDKYLQNPPMSKAGLIQLPEIGKGYIIVDNYVHAKTGENWGTPETVKSLLSLAEKWAEYDDSLLRFNDLSIEIGGKFGPHGTHHNGKYVDIRLIRKDGGLGDTNIYHDTYDKVKTKELVRLLIEDPNVEKILFNDVDIIREFENNENGVKIMKYPGHDDHLHVQFKR